MALLPTSKRLVILWHPGNYWASYVSDQKIEELQNVRSSIIESVNHARDYLNWYEATKIDKKSTNYSKYQKIYNELKLPLPPRKDELSEYLDELDKEFKK